VIFLLHAFIIITGIAGLKVNKRERYKRVKSKKRYTILNPTQIDEIHQMDFVGPRFINGYGSIYSLNLIDVVCNRVWIEQYTSKKMSNVIEFLIRYWNDNPISRYLQVDNGTYFIGDFKNPAKINQDKLPLTDGKIHFIRQVDNNGTINVLNEVFNVGEEFISEYIWATINTGKQRMEVYYRAQDQDVAALIKEFDYEIYEEIKLIRQDIWKT
jgi:hypothetical protein